GVPDHPRARAVRGRTGPIAATSANVSGNAPLSAQTDLVASFGDLVAVYLVVPPGASGPAGRSSTVVDLTTSTPTVSREGGIPAAEIRRVLSDRDRGRAL